MPFPTAPVPDASATCGNGFEHPAYRHLLARQKAPHLSELTLGLLHKFNNVFTGVVFLTEECAAQQDASESVSARLREILALLQQAHGYIDRVTQLHIDDEEEDAGYHELDAVIAHQLDLARLLLPRGTTLTHVPAGERLTFYASQRAFSEILLHLFGNCGEALPKRGAAVTISSHVEPAHPGFVAVEILDNGPGFSAETLAHLFVSAWTTKDATLHTGLGLWRCRELARAFGGDLTAANHPNGGALVTIRLPRDNSPTLS
jgi:signal transduction histidine kinase